MVFFAIWWAWMNFSWFASAYDTDDAIYRLVVLVQMAGVLVLAAGVPAMFGAHAEVRPSVGYLVMRLAMVAQWVRAAASDRSSAATALRYALGSRCCGSLGRPPAPASPLGAFVVLGVLRAGGPRAGRTWGADDLASASHRRALRPVHHHRAGRDDRGGHPRRAVGAGPEEALGALLPITGGGLLMVFAAWWIYFDGPSTIC